MCGRYASFLPAEAVAQLFSTANPLPNVAPSSTRYAHHAPQRLVETASTAARAWNLLPDLADGGGQA